VAADTSQRSLASFSCGTESHLGEWELSRVGKCRNVALINLSLSPTIKVNLIPTKRALDQGDGSDVSVKDRLGLRR
jgi:hypothetical protein